MPDGEVGLFDCLAANETAGIAAAMPSVPARRKLRRNELNVSMEKFS
jgi:hypothetical protein